MRLLKFSTNRYRNAEFGLGRILSNQKRKYAKNLAYVARDLYNTPGIDPDFVTKNAGKVGALVGGVPGGIFGGVAGGVGNAARVALENRGKDPEERRSILGAGLKGVGYGGLGGSLVGGAALGKVGSDIGKRYKTLNTRNPLQ